MSTHTVLDKIMSPQSSDHKGEGSEYTLLQRDVTNTPTSSPSSSSSSSSSLEKDNRNKEFDSLTVESMSGCPDPPSKGNVDNTPTSLTHRTADDPTGPHKQQNHDQCAATNKQQNDKSSFMAPTEQNIHSCKASKARDVDSKFSTIKEQLCDESFESSETKMVIGKTSLSPLVPNSHDRISTNTTQHTDNTISPDRSPTVIESHSPSSTGDSIVISKSKSVERQDSKPCDTSPSAQGINDENIAQASELNDHQISSATGNQNYPNKPSQTVTKRNVNQCSINSGHDDQDTSALLCNKDQNGNTNTDTSIENHPLVCSDYWIIHKYKEYSRYMNSRARPGHAYVPTAEEHVANMFTHGAIILPSVVGMLWMLRLASTSLQHNIAMVYGTSLFVLFSVSTIFHTLSYCGKFRSMKNFFHIGDRAVIYIFIAASYTPWLTLKDYNGWGMFMLWVVWIAAFLGIFYQYTFHERYKWLETLLYLIIGVCPSIVCLAMKERSGMYEMALGGSVYISGVIFFKCDGLIPFAHAIWHCFVTLGAICHYQAVCTYLLGNVDNLPEEITT